MKLISDDTRRAHRARWFVYTGAVVNGLCERVARTAGMRGPRPFGYDVVCSCGWESHTGGATRGSVEQALWEHRWTEQIDRHSDAP